MTACNPVSDDYLVYTVADSASGQNQLMFYDPKTDTHAALLPEWQIGDISLSAQNRLAFSSSGEGQSDIYVFELSIRWNDP